MRITGISAENFLSFRRLSLLDIDARLTVVVGPNGTGKSNLTRVVELTGLALALAHSGDSNFGRYLDSRHVESGDEPIVVRLGVELDQPRERRLLRDFMQTFVASQLLSPGGLSRTDVEKWVAGEITEAKLAPMFQGEFVAAWRGFPGLEEWSVGYEFAVEGETIAWSFRGPLSDTVGVGSISASEPDSGYGSVTERLRKDPQGAKSSLGLGPFDLRVLLPDERHSRIGGRPEAFQIRQTIAPFAALAAGLGVPTPQGHSILLAAVLHDVFRRSVVIVPGQRPAPRRYFAGPDTGREREPGDLGALPLELHTLQSGTSEERARYRRIQARFRELTGREFSMQAEPSRRPVTEHEDEREVEPRVAEGGAEVPLEFAGAGSWEALVLAYAMTAGDSTIVVLDEPAQNLHPTLQQRVLQGLLTRDGQSLVVTHSPYLIPTRSRNDLRRVFRIERAKGETHIHRLAPADLAVDANREQEGKLWQLFLGSTDTRGLLFAAGVVLCEGATEVGALSQWLSAMPDGNTPEERNVVFFDVGGDERFGFYVDYLNAFGIPWAIVCDSKVMNPAKTRSIHRQLGIPVARRRNGPRAGTFDRRAFARQRKRLEPYGVFTLVKEPDAEIETFLGSLNPEQWRKAGRSEGQNKIRRARVFASEVPCPREVAALWKKVTLRLHLEPA